MVWVIIIQNNKLMHALKVPLSFLHSFHFECMEMDLFHKSTWPISIHHVFVPVLHYE